MAKKDNTSEVTKDVKEKRSRRSFEEVKAEKLKNIDEKIANLEKQLETLKAKRVEVEASTRSHRSKSDKNQAADIVKGLIDQGKSLDEIKQLLGIQ